MKKRIGVLLLACLISLSLMPAAAQAALNESYPYEVTPFRIEDFSPNPGNATYVGSTAPEIEVREMTIDGNTENVSVFPAGTKFSGMGEGSFGNTVTYMNGEPDYSTYYSGRDPLPAQGVYRIEVYSNYYGYLFGYVWVTAEGSDSAEPEPEQPADPEQPGLPAQVFSDVDPNAWYAGAARVCGPRRLFPARVQAADAGAHMDGGFQHQRIVVGLVVLVADHPHQLDGHLTADPPALMDRAGDLLGLPLVAGIVEADQRIIFRHPFAFGLQGLAHQPVDQ